MAFEERRLKNVVIIEETIEGKLNGKKEEQSEQVSANAFTVVANLDGIMNSECFNHMIGNKEMLHYDRI